MIASIYTQNPERIMKRLNRHWAHKFPVLENEFESRIELPIGICTMRCDEVLHVGLESSEDDMPKLQQVVADHLQRMAGAEDLVIE